MGTAERDGQNSSLAGQFAVDRAKPTGLEDFCRKHKVGRHVDDGIIGRLVILLVLNRHSLRGV